ncbi:permease [Bacillus sp. AFS076308]|uniref:DUF979 domain-containing protein n=1 Tax=unclassified Bacillus (in: firmicutes) TaxID=185979 RepID=UPI000BF6D6E2|nr:MULTISPECIES: DUF979 domain-containing protein [unclassified Bacillus (in: firmicutes)]PFN98712.1 permease [Bacillus sp. AFS076308]PGV53508.1 permease [Bacillus sp. AFS037270]
MNIITLEYIYYLLGIITAFVAFRVAMDKKHPSRIGSTLFWGIFAFTFLFGKLVPPIVIGYLVLAMVVIAAIGKVKSGNQDEAPKEERDRHASRLQGKVFIPALVIPVFTIIGSLTLGKIHFGKIHLVDPAMVTLIALGLSTILAYIVAQLLTKAKPSTALHEGSRLMQAVGWAIILPQMLAALGAIFAKAGVGEVVSKMVSDVLPTNIPFVAVAAYCIGMALFTVIMGNAFAAFAVITGGIGLPLIVHMHGGNPAIMAAIGMFAGYCGTLMTPMAANFNIVPAMLLDLKDKNAVIKAQLPIAIPLLVINILLMYFLVYHF